MGVPGGDYRRSKADSVRASSTGFVVPRARLGAIGPQPAVRSRRRSYLASTPGKTTPLATGAAGPRGFASGSPSLYYFPCALSPGQEGDLYWVHWQPLWGIIYLYREAKVIWHGVTMTFRCMPWARAEHGRHALLLHRSIDTWGCIRDYVSLIRSRTWFTRNLLCEAHS